LDLQDLQRLPSLFNLTSGLLVTLLEALLEVQPPTIFQVVHLTVTPLTNPKRDLDVQPKM
jgi:hypothetical protein